MKAVKRSLYRIKLHLGAVIDLRSEQALATVGLNPEELGDVDHALCQRVGGAVAWFGSVEGLLVPSASNSGGSNLVIFPTGSTEAFEFSVVDSEIISPGEIA